LRTLALTDAGSLVLNREAVDPAALVHDALASFKTQAERGGIALSADLADNVPLVDVDPARLRGVLANLLSNSMRHTPAGGSVVVGARPSGDQVVISVTDTGEGIAPDLLPRVFERFVRGPNSTGSGLGLAIAHDVITAHGGKVDIESALGSGTTVRITVPSVPPPNS
jgi:two-component system sensor histidine kinase BaeS